MKLLLANNNNMPISTWRGSREGSDMRTLLSVPYGLAVSFIVLICICHRTNKCILTCILYEVR